MLVYSEHKNIEVELSSTSEGVFITKWSWAPLIHCTKMPLLLGKTMQCTPKNKQLGINCKQLFSVFHPPFPLPLWVNWTNSICVHIGGGRRGGDDGGDVWRRRGAPSDSGPRWDEPPRGPPPNRGSDERWQRGESNTQPQLYFDIVSFYALVLLPEQLGSCLKTYIHNGNIWSK